jgi:hypothetical protein
MSARTVQYISKVVVKCCSLDLIFDSVFEDVEITEYSLVLDSTVLISDFWTHPILNLSKQFRINSSRTFFSYRLVTSKVSKALVVG